MSWTESSPTQAAPDTNPHTYPVRASSHTPASWLFRSEALEGLGGGGNSRAKRIKQTLSPTETQILLLTECSLPTPPGLNSQHRVNSVCLLHSMLSRLWGLAPIMQVCLGTCQFTHLTGCALGLAFAQTLEEVCVSHYCIQSTESVA